MNRAITPVAAGAMLAAFAAACSPEDPATTSIQPTPTGSASPLSACPAVSLLSPDGQPVDLSGTWLDETGGRDYYHVVQHGSCVWFSGFTESPHAAGYTTVVFEGRIGTDFLVVGRWAQTAVEGSGNQTAWGTLTLKPEFPGANQDLTLRAVASTTFGREGGIVTGQGWPYSDLWAQVSDTYLYPLEPEP